MRLTRVATLIAPPAPARPARRPGSGYTRSWPRPAARLGLPLWLAPTLFRLFLQRKWQCAKRVGRTLSTLSRAWGLKTHANATGSRRFGRLRLRALVAEFHANGIRGATRGIVAVLLLVLGVSEHLLSAMPRPPSGCQVEETRIISLSAECRPTMSANSCAKQAVRDSASTRVNMRVRSGPALRSLSAKGDNIEFCCTSCRI